MHARMIMVMSLEACSAGKCEIRGYGNAIHGFQVVVFQFKMG